MPRITEKLEFMTGRAVKVCTKTGIGRSPGYKKNVFMRIFRKTASERRFLDSLW